MQYQGGKHIAAPHLVEAMEQNGLAPAAGVLEPFCGGGSVTVALAKAGHHIWASDTNASLILMWQKVMVQDLEEFPLDAESYQTWKTAPDSAEKAIVGIGAPFAVSGLAEWREWQEDRASCSRQCAQSTSRLRRCADGLSSAA